MFHSIPCLSADFNLNDLHVYDPIAATWTNLEDKVRGYRPLPRIGPGFTALQGILYVFGGADEGESAYAGVIVLVSS